MQKLKKLARKIFPVSLLRLVEKSYRRGRGLLWQARYGFPARGMRVIAVTGTNGKTTTCSYINEILKAAGYKTAVLNTVYYEIGGERLPNKTHFTIDKQSIVQSFFAKARRAKVDFVVLEVTSHALDQDRLMGVKVEIAVLSNLTQDHLDYHGTMERYAAAKALLFKNFCAKQAVLNADDKWHNYFKQAAKAVLFTYGKANGSTLKISGIKPGPAGTKADFSVRNKSFAVNTKLPGEFNVYNAAAAASTATILGIGDEQIVLGISSLKELAGRMEEVKEGQSFKVFVDFAITPDALEKALTATREITAGKVLIVFGATGDRDKVKRPDMGRAAAKYADLIYLTDDETYTEDPENIRNDVLEGIKQAKAESRTEVIPDREKAIKEAFKHAKKGDAVLITGLGHEDSRNMGGKLVAWNDVETAKSILHN